MKKILAFFAVMAAVSAHSAFSQDITLTFTGARTDGRTCRRTYRRADA